MSLRHFICTIVAAAAVIPAAPGLAQQPAAPAFQPGTTSGFMIFLRGNAIGVEQMAVSRTTEGWSILSTGRLAQPLDIVARKLEVRYTADWKPIAYTLDSVVRGEFQRVITTVTATTAASDITVGTQTTAKSDTIDPASLLLPNAMYGPYEALSAVLRTATAGSTIPAYQIPLGSVQIRVVDSTTEQIQTTSRLITAKRTHVTVSTTNPPVDINVWGDETGRLLRLTVPAQGLDVARSDIASVSARQVAISRPNDESVRILANGFSLAGTVSKPAEPAKGPFPAVVLTGTLGQTDRDELVAGIPILGQLAGALADAGFLVVRYDKRGVGQSGGRADAVTLADYADDQRAAVRYLTTRKDVDSRRIAVVGHGEGGLISLITAANEKKVGAVVLLGTNGIAGTELVLQQQQHALGRMNIGDTEKQARIEMQKRINAAAVTGKGLDGLTPDVRRQVENPEFQSMLSTDPAKLIAKVHQPILAVQGELDTEVAPSNADRIAEAAKARKPPLPADVVKVPGVNHLLAMSVTGEPDEYEKLPLKQISPAVASAVVDWLKKNLK
ncbi:MAG TPA: alpha/beta fold hydrolase [Vicinamibacterales bacterium]|nr:alpha/beta fold hydrolase [Vicinamibacterales bacterium]